MFSNTKINRREGVVSNESIAEYIDTHMQNNLGTVSPKGSTKMLSMGMESLSVSERDVINDASKSARTMLEEAYRNSGRDEEWDTLTEAQIDAGVIAVTAGSDPVDYITSTRATVQVAPGTDVEPMSSDSSVDSRVNASLEAFDARGMDKYIAINPVFNINAARQDDFGEAFFPTITTTPDKAGLILGIQRTMVHNEYRHLGDGAPAPEGFNSRPIIDAAIDHRILKTDTTRIVPQYSEDNPYFSKVVGPRQVTIGNTKVRTAPLAAGRRLNLLSISQNPSINPTGVNDHTDQLDHLIAIDTLYISVTDKAGKVSVIPQKVLRLPQAEFYPSAEGQTQDMSLNFTTVDLPLNGKSLTVDKSEAEALSFLRTGTRAAYTVRLGVSVNGSANVEVGNIQISPTQVEIVSVYNMVDGQPVEVVDTDELELIRTELPTIAVDSYDIHARRTNLNRRERGLLVRNEAITRRYMIPLGAPVTATMPITNTPTQVDISAPIDAVRQMNSSEAVTKLLEYAETLDQYRASMDRLAPIPRIEGIGTFLMRPYFDHIELKLADVVDSTSSHERAADIRAAIVEVIRDGITKAAISSGYYAALNAAGGGTPEVVIGTDARIARYLMVDGDPRLLGSTFNHKIVTSPDNRLIGKVFATFSRPNAKEPDGLGFGNMIWIPELVTDVPNSRGGAQAREIMVQPRRRHICHLPILVVIDVLDLNAMVKDRVGIRTVPYLTEQYVEASNEIEPKTPTTPGGP